MGVDIPGAKNGSHMFLAYPVARQRDLLGLGKKVQCFDCWPTHYGARLIVGGLQSDLDVVRT